MAKILTLCTSDDVAEWGRIGNLEARDQALIQQFIRGFSTLAERRTGRMFYDEQRTRDFNVMRQGTRLIRLPAFGGSDDAIDNVWESSGRTFDGTTLLGADDYHFDGQGAHATGFLYRDHASWTSGPGVVRVQWTAGFGTNVQSVPDDLRMAAAMQVAHWWKHRDNIGTKTRSTDKAGSVTVEDHVDKVLAIVDETLNSYALD